MNLELVTRKEISQTYKVTIETVRNWEKKGLITPFCHINGKPRYHLSDVLQGLSKKEGGQI